VSARKPAPTPSTPLSAESSSPLSRFLHRRGIFYGWVIVGCAFVTMFVALGFRYAFGVFYAAILEDTGWTRADTAAVFSLAMAVYAAMAVPAGWLFDKIGARRLFTAGALLLGAGLMLCSRATTVPGLLVSYGLLAGLGFAALGFIPHAAIIPRWFDRKRGLALAAALSGVGFGSLGMSSGSAMLIESLGWRTSMLAIGAACWALLIPINALLHHAAPRSLGQHPDGAAEPSQVRESRHTERIPIRHALAQPSFWLLFMSVSMMGLVSMTMAVHQPRLVVDLGFSLNLSAFLFGILGFLRTVGGLIWGPLSDRIGRGPCVWIVIGLSIAGFGALVVTGHLYPPWDGWRLPLLLAFTLVFGLGYNGISPIYASAVADHFAGPSLGTMFGLLDLGFGLGAAAGPWIAGWAYDHFASYEGVLWGLTLGVLLTGIGLVFGARQKAA